MESSTLNTSSSNIPRTWSSVVIPLGIVACAIAMRGCFLWGSPDRSWPHGALYEGDAPLWIRFAQAIREGRPFEFGLPVHPPGMAWLLAWVAPLGANSNYLFIKLIVVVFGSVNCLLAATLARRIFGTFVGATTGLLCAASFGLTVQSATLNNETPYTLLLLLSILMIHRGADPIRLGRASLWGGVNALAALLRPEHVLIFAMLTAYSLCRDSESSQRRPGQSRAGAMCVAVAIFMLIPIPWSIRAYDAITRYNTVESEAVNYDALGIPWAADARDAIAEHPAFARLPNAHLLSALAKQRNQKDVTRPFIQKWLDEEVQYTPRPLSPITFISNQGPLAFALANNEHADGGFSTTLLDTVMGAPPAEGAVSTHDFAFANPRHLRLYQHGYFAGLQYIYLNPVAAMSLAGKKLAIFMSGVASGFTLWNIPTGVTGTRRPVDQLAVNLSDAKLWSLLILALVMVGVFTALRRGIGGTLLVVIGAKLLITLAFFGYARQGVASLPLVYAFVSLGIERLFITPFVQPGPAASSLSRRCFHACCAFIILSSLWLGGRGWSYDITGQADPAPQWGASAFESHQPLRIDVIR